MHLSTQDILVKRFTQLVNNPRRHLIINSTHQKMVLFLNRGDCFSLLLICLLTILSATILYFFIQLIN